MLKRRETKEQIVEAERNLATGAGYDTNAREIGQAANNYAHAARWFENHVANEYKQKAKRSKQLSIFFGVLTFMSIGAVLLLTPLKTIVPYVIRVDNNTGFIDIVKPYNQQAGLTQKEADIESTLRLYVEQRESYNGYDQDARYDTVRIMTDSDAFSEYKNFQLSNKGYVSMWGNNEQIRVKVNNIYPLNSTYYEKTGVRTYQVRYTRSFFDASGQPDPMRPDAVVLATVSFKYVGMPKAREEQWINPQGFKVVAYQTSQEIAGNS